MNGLPIEVFSPELKVSPGSKVVWFFSSHMCFYYVPHACVWKLSKEGPPPPEVSEMKRLITYVEGKCK